MRIVRAGMLVGLLPWGLSAATTLLALVTFIPGAWLVHALLKERGLA